MYKRNGDAAKGKGKIYADIIANADPEGNDSPVCKQFRGANKGRNPTYEEAMENLPLMNCQFTLKDDPNFEHGYTGIPYDDVSGGSKKYGQDADYDSEAQNITQKYLAVSFLQLPKVDETVQEESFISLTRVKSEARPTQPQPYILPWEFNHLAAAVYGPQFGDWSIYKGCKGFGLYAQQFGLDALGYRCLESHTFIGSGFGGPKDANFQIMLIEHNTKEHGKKKLMLFEGTTPEIGSWLMDIASFLGIDNGNRRLLKLMNKKMKSWEQKHQFNEYYAFTGHSAGCLYTKYSMDEEERMARGNPYLVCWNGFDAKKTKSPKMIEFRTTGDVVSACGGGPRKGYPKNAKTRLFKKCKFCYIFLQISLFLLIFCYFSCFFHQIRFFYQNFNFVF